MSDSESISTPGPAWTNDAPEFYADGVWCRWNPYGFDLEFGQGGSGAPDASPKLTAVIHMSPQLALVLGRLLRDEVDKYQEAFGKLPVSFEGPKAQA